MSQTEGDDFDQTLAEWRDYTQQPQSEQTEQPSTEQITEQTAEVGAPGEQAEVAAPSVSEVPERTWERVLERDRAAQQALQRAKQLEEQYKTGYIRQDDLAADFKVNPIAVIRQLAGDDFDFAQLSEDSWHESKGAEATPAYRAIKQAREAQLAANKALRGNQPTSPVQSEEVENSEVSQEVWNDYFAQLGSYISSDAKANNPTLGSFAELNPERAMQVSVNAAQELAQQPGRTSWPTNDEVAAHAEKLLKAELELWSKIGGSPGEQVAQAGNTQAVSAQPTTLTNKQQQVQPPRVQGERTDADDWADAVMAASPGMTREEAMALYRP